MNQNNWKEFKIGEIFSLENCKCGNAGELTSGNDLFYIGAKKNDNGVMKKVAYESNLISKGNCIIFICDGQGSVGYCNYMDRDFIGSTTLTVGYNDNLNKYNAMFIVTILDKEKFKYSYGRKYRPHLENTKIKLPEKYGVPDWDFMENYIKSLNFKNVTIKNKQNSISLNYPQWMEFKLSEIFTITRGNRLTKENRESGNFPFVTAGYENWGVSEYINNQEEDSYYNAITIDMFGNAFYFERDFKCDDNVLVLKSSKLNKYSGLFIATILKQDKYRNSYGRQYRQKDFNNHIVKLPSKNNKPDWEFMDNFIKALSYGDRI
ncbi:MAG: hypothetical protein E7359_03170 [Clostridiales bacterium]|nr:hypothetical protein [Clostridiales bacterium]